MPVKQRLKKALPAPALRLYSTARRTAYRVLGPFDFAWLLLNGRSDLPPIYLRERVGPLRTFESSAAEFMVQLKLLCKLRPEDHVLDIGCGCGAVALHLLHWLNSSGSYVGMDVDAAAIAWCRRTLEKKRPNFTFSQMDVKSHVYNRHGSQSCADYRFPFGSGGFDLIFAKSVFTHLLPDGSDNYLSEVSRLLSPQGRCLATFFVLSQATDERANKGLSRLNFAYGPGPWRYVDKTAPEGCVGYSEAALFDQLAKHGLELKQPLYPGSWSGLEGTLGFQDVLVLGRL